MTDFLDFVRLERPDSPNTYLVAPEGLCQNATPDDASPVFDKSERGLFSTLAELIAKQRRWVDVQADPEQLRFKFIAKTALLGFKDDVDIMILPADPKTGTTESGTRLAVYSRSRVGYSDLGANRKRITALLENLTTK